MHESDTWEIKLKVTCISLALRVNKTWQAATAAKSIRSYRNDKSHQTHCCMAKWHDIVAYDEDLGSGLGGKNKTKQKKQLAPVMEKLAKHSCLLRIKLASPYWMLRHVATPDI